jgi:hypothetical protein
MAIKVTKVADIVEQEIIISDQRKYKPGEIFGILTHLPPARDPHPEFQWTITVEVGKPPRQISVPLYSFIDKSDCLDSPLFLGDGKMIYFRHGFYIPERLPRAESDYKEIALRVKKAAYDDEAEIANLRSAVANLEAAVAFKKAGPKRDSIPEDVKLVVWARDGGACVRCGSKQNLHFDHIIPVAKGGGNSEKNIQILCDHCNLQKSDKISF